MSGSKLGHSGEKYRKGDQGCVNFNNRKRGDQGTLISFHEQLNNWLFDTYFFRMAESSSENVPCRLLQVGFQTEWYISKNGMVIYACASVPMVKKG